MGGNHREQKSGCPYCVGNKREEKEPEPELTIEDVIQEQLGKSVEETKEELLQLILEITRNK